MNIGRFTRYLVTLIALPAACVAQTTRFSFDDAQAFLKSHCQMCHTGNIPAGGFGIQQVSYHATIRDVAPR